MAEGGGAVPDAGNRRLAMARWILAARRLRGRFFGDELFADPAWDMLLDLYVAHRTGRAVSVSSLCLAAGVPQTTALRWIKQLTDRGLLSRRNDDVDRRRVNVALSTETIATFEAYLDAGLALSRQA